MVVKKEEISLKIFLCRLPPTELWMLCVLCYCLNDQGISTNVPDSLCVKGLASLNIRSMDSYDTYIPTYVHTYIRLE